ncbi:hypothetical protein D3Z38_04545 [Clostridiales bacterium]|nr:hypothetical protein [Clostridiales bacterium]
MMLKRKKLMPVCILMLVLAMVFTGCGGKGDGDSGSVTLRLASDAPEDHIATGINKELCDMVQEQTDGRVTIKYYPGSQLGGYETVYDELKMGSIDCAQISLPDANDSRLSMPYVPYLATNFDEAKILYGKDSYMTKTFTGLTKKDHVKFLGWVLEGFIGTGLTKEPNDIKTPESKKNVKLRVSQTIPLLYLGEDLHYNTVTIPYAEVPTAIQTNVVDG